MPGLGRALARAALAAARSSAAAESAAASTRALPAAARVSEIIGHPAHRPRLWTPNASRSFASSTSGSSGPVGWKSLAAMCATGGGLLYMYDMERQRRLESIKAGPSSGKASIGGPFGNMKLANDDGARWHTDELKGKFALLYFGFTMCPDICPDELEKMAECVDLVEKAGKTISPVFISIDPERDTVKRVKEYVKEFHPRLIGVTGSVEACKSAAKQYRVYYHKTGDEDGDDYLVDHSIIMYLVDPNGEFVTFYGKNYEAAPMAEAILEQMKRLGH